MSDIPYLGQTTDTILGQDFLTWLWFQSDTAPDGFTDKKGIPFSISMEQRVVVQGGEGNSLETASVSGALSPLREARLGLSTGKKVTRALLHIKKDDLAWQFTVKADDFSCNSLKTPKLEKDDPDVNTDALLLEKLYLMETCMDLWDSVYARFLALRLADSWGEEVRQMRAWITRVE